jgi:hypothetical protein
MVSKKFQGGGLSLKRLNDHRSNCCQTGMLMWMWPDFMTRIQWWIFIKTVVSVHVETIWHMYKEFVLWYKKNQSNP